MIEVEFDYLAMLKVLGRIITILPLALFATLYMGKRSIGELPIFDFLVILTLGAVVGADIADPEINHIYTAIAVVAIAILQKMIAKLKIRSRKIGRMLTFEPTMVIYDGKFLVENMKKISYSIDIVLMMLREQQVYNLEDVEIGIIEANGMLSVKLFHQKENARVEHIQKKISSSYRGIDVPVIIDGEVYEHVLSTRNLDEDWLVEELRKKNVLRLNDVFYASLNDYNELHVSCRNNKVTSLPPLFH